MRRQNGTKPRERRLESCQKPQKDPAPARVLTWVSVRFLSGPSRKAVMKGSNGLRLEKKPNAHSSRVGSKRVILLRPPSGAASASSSSSTSVSGVLARGEASTSCWSERELQRQTDEPEPWTCRLKITREITPSNLTIFNGGLIWFCFRSVWMDCRNLKYFID